ncbi:SDR family oxidoreductase [Rubrobacter tropicus]|uniref:SDR family oxidoreductase n=1 Tax=Rubrobacter tropicus TaxID=2653851 RepID=A0A6G8Q656_9ACTN|nr:SDR family oxidoreductase [Rubrobacter tropicus]QIN81933.1 SDR family oxidoreductase [Rubrobacter tropicus]
MDLGLAGKTALVTAASKGLGRAIATELAREGARVVISSRDEATLARTAEEIGGETGAEVGYRAADLTKGSDIEALVAHAVDRFGGIDILVNNTGGPPTGFFADLDDEAWDLAFRQIILSLVRCVRGVLPSMRERGGGRIVNVASSSVKQPIDNLLLSNTFRAGLNGLAKSLSLELAPDGILVNTLGPGRILTGRTESVDAGQAEAQGVSVGEVREQFAARIPLGRYGTPEEFARVAAFLASPANGYVTGQAILVDGGMVRAL